MSAHTGDPAIHSTARSSTYSRERSLEAAVLLRALTELHEDEILTNDEYETKRRLLGACI